MDWDEVRKPAAGLTVGEPIDTLSVGELEQRIGQLEAEIVRIKAELEKKKAHEAAASQLFKR